MRTIITLVLFSTAYLFSGGVLSAATSTGTTALSPGPQPIDKALFIDDALFKEIRAEARAMGFIDAHLDVRSEFAGMLNDFLDVTGNYSGLHPTFFARELTSDAILEPGSDVTFEATRSITLRTGFWAKAGSTFCARIVPICDETGDNARSLLNSPLGNREE